MSSAIYIKAVVLGSIFAGWTLIPGPASARPLDSHFGSGDSCYARVYSKEHLKKHSTQRVTEIRFNHFPTTFGVNDESGAIKFNPATGELFFTISVRFRDSEKLYVDGGSCLPDGDQYRCNIECDGGGFVLKDRTKDTILLVNQTGFSVSGCDGEDYREVQPEPDDKVFRLDRLPKLLCKPPE